ncbi:MAG TPA: penicillin acylase family protein [Gemmatimonadaceae bacterium]
MKKLILVLTLAIGANAAAQTPANVAAWERQAKGVTITRDDWGIAHIVGKTDADAVFGLIYEQAEDDFNRVETNFINSMGRLAEAEGEKEIYRDLRMKLFINPDSMKVKYAASPAWLQKLMVAWADGLNFYLYKHPEVKPRVIKRFEPWMALTFSEGSIGGDIEKVNLNQLEAMYGGGGTPSGRSSPPEDDDAYQEPSGSNGIAIAPSNTLNHHALLLINPHTSFFFRSEVQVTSDEGLNAYGAVTWGQFFIYQGFNERTGWMHTTSGVNDQSDYAETVTKKGDGYVYKYGAGERPLTAVTISVPYKTATGMSKKDFTVYYSSHGPIVRRADGKWVAVKMMQEQVKALTQSYTRTKQKDYKSFAQTMELHTNSSNNTIFADGSGNIAYFHGNFIPKRDPKFDWSKPVDGSDPATEWQGLLSVKESPLLLNPASGFIYNSNNWPWSAAGPSSQKKEDFPAWVETGREESPRGYHALKVLPGKKDFTLSSLISTAYDSYLPSFERMIPPLLKAYDDAAASNPLKAKLAEQIAVLRAWDYRWAAQSVATSLAVFWGEDVSRRVGADARRAGMSSDAYIEHGAPGDVLLQSLASATDKLAADFGKWKTPWGDINRFQRVNGDIVQQFDDAKPSIPVGFASARWGSLASFGARAYPGTKKWYGTSGNSFVAVVEFGDSVRARAVSAGGESGDPASKHFNDGAQNYATGNLREVYFYKNQLKGHTERVYHPGE